MYVSLPVLLYPGEYRKRELIVLNVSFNNIEYIPPELGDLVLLK